MRLKAFSFYSVVHASIDSHFRGTSLAEELQIGESDYSSVCDIIIIISTL